MKRFFMSYKLLVLLSIVVTALTAQLLVSSTSITEVDRAAVELNNRLKRLRISESEKLLRNLRKDLERKELATFTDVEARGWLLEVLDEFRSLYGADIKRSLTRNGSSYTAEISFKYVPDNPNDLLQLLGYMKTSIAPIYSIKWIRFSKDKRGRSVAINAEIIQPYRGGKYEY